MRLGRGAAAGAALLVAAAVAILLVLSADDALDGTDGAASPSAGAAPPPSTDTRAATGPAAVPAPAADEPPLPADASVVLRLVDETGAPLRDGRASAVRTDRARGGWVHGLLPEFSTFAPHVPDASAVADTVGRVVLTGLAPGEWLATADAPGRARRTVRFVRAADPEPLEIIVRMAPGHVLGGRVLDPRGAPVAGVVVAATAPGDARNTPDPATRTEARSARDGTWRLDGLAAGRVPLWIWREGRGWRERGLVAVPEVPRLDIVLPDGGLVTGVVRDGATGLPVAGARVEVWSNSWEPFAKPIAAGTSDGEGRYAIRLGDWYGSFELLRVRAAGFADAALPPVERGSAAADAGEVVECDVSLEPECRVAGRVTGPAGPIAGATVRVWMKGTGPFGEFVAWETRTADDGGYAFGGLAPGEVVVESVADGFRRPSGEEGHFPPSAGSLEHLPADLRRTLERGTTATVDIALTAKETPPVRLVVNGVVRKEDGAPVASARVNVWGIDPSWTLRDGTFRIEAAVETDYGATIAATAPDGGTAEGPDVEVGKPETWRDVVLVVRPGPAIRGRVRSLAGRPVGGARVTLGRLAVNKFDTETTSWDQARAVEAADDGSFVLPLADHRSVRRSAFGGSVLPPAILGVVADGHAAAFSRVFEIGDPPADVAIDVEIEAGHIVRGRVLDAASDAALEGASVYVNAGAADDWGVAWPPTSAPEERGWLAAVTGADGTFVAKNLRPGTWTVEASARGRHGEHLEVAVPSAGDVTLRLRRTGAISGRVLDPSGRPVAGASVALVDPSLPEEERQGPVRRTNADGGFEFPAVAHTKWRLDVVPRDAASDAGPASVEDVVPGSTGLVVQLPRAHPIAGRLVAADGSPVADANIRCVREDGTGEDEWASTAEDGSFRVGRLRAGKHALRFYGVVVEVTGVAAGTADLVVKATGALAVSGRVLDPNGEPAQGGSLDLAPPGTDPDDTFRVRSTWIEEDGTFSFPHLPEGEYDLTLHLGRDADGKERVPTRRVRAGTTGLEIRIPPDPGDGR